MKHLERTNDNSIGRAEGVAQRGRKYKKQCKDGFLPPIMANNFKVIIVPDFFCIL